MAYQTSLFLMIPVFSKRSFSASFIASVYHTTGKHIRKYHCCIYAKSAKLINLRQVYSPEGA